MYTESSLSNLLHLAKALSNVPYAQFYCIITNRLSDTS